MRRWFALHTKLRAERRVVAQLARHDVETFLPEARTTAENASSRPAPFFPGYVFIRIDLKTRRSAVWRWLPGVRYIVAYGKKPVPIADEVIQLIRQRTAEANSAAMQPQVRFNSGDLVRIKEGPFRDMLAVFDGPSEPSERVRVLLQAMDKSMRLRLPLSNLEEVKANNKDRRGKPPRRTRGRGRPINS
jgi:transcriptional antiterminator RfaH